MPTIDAHLEILRNAVNSLDPTGPEGFEGLVAKVLGRICGWPFRLASSGSQRGRDASASRETGDIYFEAKRYRTSIDRKTLSDKILELVNEDDGVLDLWVLAATVAVSDQHASHCRRGLERHGIGFLLLDWAEEQELPLMPLALAMGGEATHDVLAKHSPSLALLDAALAAITSHALFASCSATLAASISLSAPGLEVARRDNRQWLDTRFSSRREARLRFGQALAPFDSAGTPWLARPSLSDLLLPAFDGAPTGKAFAVVGEEGVGKSWLIPEAWARADPRPLLIVVTANELQGASWHDVENALLDKLTEQTGKAHHDLTKARWRRRLKAWRATPSEGIRITLFLDGLNQAPSPLWPARLDATSGLLAVVGGQLVFTTRTTHFARHLKRQLTTEIDKIDVGEWSDTELETLLRMLDVEANALSHSVRGALRNPRLLGLAIELLGGNALQSVHSLSVERLLFEHMKQSDHTPLEGAEFASLLTKLGRTVFERLSKAELDDLKLFDTDFDARLKAVADTRFFAAVAGDAGLYEIRKEGLSLGLGLWLLEVLQKEERNDRNPNVALETLLDPLSALDQTADVLAAAAMAGKHGDQPSTAIIAALVRSYAVLQNPNPDLDGAFVSLAHTVPDAFVSAIQELLLDGIERFNATLLLSALDDVDDASVARGVTQWFSYYSLSPEGRMFTLKRGAPAEEVDAERAKIESKTADTLDALSPSERTFREQRLVLLQGRDLGALHRMGFRLLAGRPLAHSAAGLVNWCFARALNPTLDSPLDEFLHLVRLNKVDWADTRRGLLSNVERFRDATSSTAGRWALVHTLRSTGDVRDAAEAEDIALELTKDREGFRGWRRVEALCDTDPCDPDSVLGTNVDDTVRRFQELDVSTLSTGASVTEAEGLLRDATPALARFRPEAAIEVYRKLSVDTAMRDAEPRRFGVLGLIHHSSALDASLLTPLVKAAQSSSATSEDDSAGARHEWFTAQYSLVLAMPRLSGDEQLATIANLQQSSLLVPLLDLSKPATPAVAEEVLESAIRAGSLIAQRNILAFLLGSRTGITDRVSHALSTLLASADNLTRVSALGVAAFARDEALVCKFAELGWAADALAPGEHLHERWYGSSLLLQAAERGCLDSASLLRRISPEFIGIAATKLPPAAVRSIALEVAKAFNAVLVFDGDLQLPHSVNQPVVRSGADLPPRLSLGDDTAPRTLDDFVKATNESPEEFYARQTQTWDAVHRTLAELHEAGAWLPLKNMTLDGMRALAHAAPDLAQLWRDALLATDSTKLAALHEFGLQLVAVTADRDSRALPLLRRLLETKPFVNLISGLADLPYQLSVAWSLSHIRNVRDICFERLDRAPNDYAISLDVLAALASGKSDELNEYIRSRSQVSEPWAVCRALMVAGFSEPSEECEAMISVSRQARGFIGTAAQAAHYAYERNVWAQKWYGRMRGAESPSEFWRSAVLLSKIVDGRYTVWTPSEDTSPTFDSFRETLQQPIRQRIKRWAEKRRQTLFGGKVPDPAFVSRIPGSAKRSR